MSGMVSAFLPSKYRVAFIASRNVVLPLAVVASLYFLPYQFILGAMIIGGHAHFFMAYLYQWRGGKMTTFYLFLAAILLVGVGGYFIVFGDFIPLYLAVSVLFITHFSIDELTLHDEAWTLEKVTTLFSVVAVFLVLVIHSITPITLIVIAVLITTMVGVLVRLVRRLHQPSSAEWYLWFLEVLVVLMVFNIIPVPITAITSFIIILHFFNWMVGYGVRLWDTPKRNTYIVETIVSIFCFSIFYFLFVVFSDTLFALFFTTSAYYAWAIIHIGLSFYLYRPRWG